MRLSNDLLDITRRMFPLFLTDNIFVAHYGVQNWDRAIIPWGTWMGKELFEAIATAVEDVRQPTFFWSDAYSAEPHQYACELRWSYNEFASSDARGGSSAGFPSVMFDRSEEWAVVLSASDYGIFSSSRQRIVRYIDALGGIDVFTDSMTRFLKDEGFLDSALKGQVLPAIPIAE